MRKALSTRRECFSKVIHTAEIPILKITVTDPAQPDTSKRRASPQVLQSVFSSTAYPAVVSSTKERCK